MQAIVQETFVHCGLSGKGQIIGNAKDKPIKLHLSDTCTLFIIGQMCLKKVIESK